MKFLLQAYKFPPVAHPGALRWYQFAQALERQGITYHVQTSSNQPFFEQNPAWQHFSERAQLIPTKDYRTRHGQLKGEKTSLSTKEKSGWLYKLFQRFYHTYPFVLFTGDGGRTYLRESVRRASQLIEAEGITHVVSSFRPWADHIVAYRLKQRYPQLVWVADFRDLPVDPVRKDVWWPSLQSWWQRRLLRKADVVTTVSDGLARHFQKDHHRVVVVRNGLDKLPNNFLTSPASAHFTITYTGALYPGLQSADPLLSVLRQLIADAELNPAHLELHYAGKDGDLWQQWTTRHALGYLTVQHGFVPLEQARTLQRNSQINLLLSWSAENYGGIMTSKLGSYLMAGRPIVCLLNGPPDPELNQLVEATGSGHVYPSAVPTSKDELRHFILDAYRTWAFAGALPWRSNPSLLAPYTWENQLNNLFQSLI